MFDDVTTLCGLCLTYHPITNETMQRCTFRDPNFDPKFALVAVEDEKPIGFMFGARRVKYPMEHVGEPKAWIKIFCVHPQYRRRGIATKLLNQLEELMKAEGRKELRVADFAGWHFFPGVDIRYEDAIDFLLAKGFKKDGETVDYLIDLISFTVPRRIIRLEKMLIDERIVFRKPSFAEKSKVQEWIEGRFGKFWTYEVGEAFRAPTPKVWVAEKGDEILGFSAYSALERYWFGPIGVSDQIKHKGLGTVLLFKTLDSMREEGCSTACIPWTGHLFFYTQVPGIMGVRHYWKMSKPL